MRNPISITQMIKKPVEQVWSYYNDPGHIVKWNQASIDWHTVSAENNLTAGGRFNYRMEAKDGSFGFNFEGTYEKVENLHQIDYVLDDNRHVSVTFSKKDMYTKITVIFEPEAENDPMFQEQGWLAILTSFKNYAENQK